MTKVEDENENETDSCRLALSRTTFVTHMFSIEEDFYLGEEIASPGNNRI